MTSLRSLIRTVLPHVAIINYGGTNSTDVAVGSEGERLAARADATARRAENNRYIA